MEESRTANFEYMNGRLLWVGAILSGVLWLLQGGLATPVVRATTNKAACAPEAYAACQQTGPAQPVTDLPLPDLQTLPPFDLHLIVNAERGTRLLRFSNSVANTGSGPLDLRGELDSATQNVTLVQQVLGAEGTQITQRLGGFAYHPEHYHWHWEGFSVYEVWTLGLIADLDEKVINSGKVGYCMLDSARINTGWLQANNLTSLAAAAGSGYRDCGWRRQGISVGWVDTYLYDVPGQVMDVSALADGVYALRSIVDPDGLLAESNKRNNAALVYFRLEGNRLTVLRDVRFARSHIFRSLYGEDQPESKLHSDRY